MSMAASQTSEWTREKTIQLINEYRKNRGLWDMTHEDYRKKDVKRELLHKVAQNIDNGKIPALEIEKKFHTLRTQYHREIHRMKRSEPYNSKWFGFKHLEFLSSPKACRQSKNFQYIKLETPKCQSKQEIYITPKYSESGGSNPTEYYIERKESDESDSNRDSRNSRDLEKLIAETTKDVEEEHLIEEEIEDDESHGNDPIIDSKQNVIIKHVTAEIYNEEPHGSTHHIVNPEDQLTLEDDNLTYHQTGRILKIQTRRSGANEFETHYTTADETSVQPAQSDKKFSFSDTPTFTIHKPSTQSLTEQSPNSSARLVDDFVTYGEYIANELRQIQGRETLIQLKHKINTSIYEALIADMQNK